MPISHHSGRFAFVEPTKMRGEHPACRCQPGVIGDATRWVGRPNPAGGVDDAPHEEIARRNGGLPVTIEVENGK
jgi:hypothetical protein